MSDYNSPGDEHGFQPPHEGWETPHQEPEHDRESEPQGDRESTRASGPRAKRRGPKPMTNQPTTRFEGQLYLKQYERGNRVINRLKIENRSVPSAERRRMTLNTLVRIGMAVVLEHESALHGRSEEELLEALRNAIAARIRSESHDQISD